MFGPASVWAVVWALASPSVKCRQFLIDFHRGRCGAALD
jgi:hypothetical protein